MRSKPHLFITAIALAGSVPPVAGAEPVAPFDGPPSAGAILWKFCADEGPLFQAQMAFIEAKLNLQPAQRESWQAFVADASAAAQSIRTFCGELPQPADNDAVGQLDLRQKMLTAILETHLALTTAAQKPIAVLNSEQQSVFADPFLFPFLPPPPLGPLGPFI
jgi:LTXXQ motif family protein